MATQTKKAVDDQRQRIPCNICRHETLHKLLKKTHDHIDDELELDEGIYVKVWCETAHEMFECCGCRAVVLRQTVTNSEELERPEIRFFPPPASRSKPDWFYRLPDKFHPMLNEIYNSLDADNRALPMMGARTVLDMVFVDKIGDTGTFGEKLKQLESQGFISKKNREVLDAALNAGSAAAHRGYQPKLTAVQSVMDIVENLLQAIYVLDKQALEIKKSTPARPAAKKKTHP